MIILDASIDAHIVVGIATALPVVVVLFWGFVGIARSIRFNVKQDRKFENIEIKISNFYIKFTRFTRSKSFSSRKPLNILNDPELHQDSRDIDE